MKYGHAWFRESEYEEFRQLFAENGETLPDTFDEWLEVAEYGLNDFRRQGHTVVKAYLHIQTFAEWCRSRSLNIDADARRKFAQEFAGWDDSQ